MVAFEKYCQQSALPGLNVAGKLSLMEAQKIAYFRFISSVEGHFIIGFGDGTGGSRATLSLKDDALAEAHKILDGDSEFRDVIGRFSNLVAGFEFPYGMELLSTVHFAATRLVHEEQPALDGVIQAIGSWSTRKASLFREEQASRAFDHLAQLSAL